MNIFDNIFKKAKNFRFVIISDDNDVNVNQWSISSKRFFIVTFIFILLSVSLFFISADFATKYLYKEKLNDLRLKSNSMLDLIIDLKSSIDDINEEMNEIENKDMALRTYANLPLIDKDVRKVGVGGYQVKTSDNFESLIPGVNSRIYIIEMNIDELQRKIRLEKESYAAIYNTIKNNSQRLSSIPSIRPVNGGYLNSGLGYRNDPFTGEKRFHHGLDISASRGTSIFATADGKVISAGKLGNYGNIIKIKHGHGYNTFYGHLHKILVKRGQDVKRGFLIGQVGNTGRSTASHLHYEVHYLGTPQDPEHYFLSRKMR